MAFLVILRGSMKRYLFLISRNVCCVFGAIDVLWPVEKSREKIRDFRARQSWVGSPHNPINLAKLIHLSWMVKLWAGL